MPSLFHNLFKHLCTPHHCTYSMDMPYMLLLYWLFILFTLYAKGKNRAQFLVCAHILIPIYNSEELYFGLTSTSDLKKNTKPLYVRYAQVGLYYSYFTV